MKTKVVKVLFGVALVFVVAVYGVGEGFFREFAQPRSSAPTGTLTFAQYRAEQHGVVDNVLAPAKYVGALVGIRYNDSRVGKATKPHSREELRMQAEGQNNKALTSL